jgi:multicomponent Na+:H+ antiporter subunit D
MAAEAQVLLAFWPLLAACALLFLPPRARLPLVLVTLAAPVALLLPLTAEIWRADSLVQELAGYAAPLGIRLVTDSLSLLLLWLVAIVAGISGLAALGGYPPASASGQRFWPLWLLLTAGMNSLLLSADLFNLYVTLELVTLAAIPLIAIAGGGALRAAMRYLLLGMLASLAYLLGIALLYSAHGTLDLYLLGELVGPDTPSRVAFALITVGLLLKTAIFPLHIWLPPAHSAAPGPVSAILSALVVKLSLYLLYRLWFWTGADLDIAEGGLLLGLLGAGAIIYGSLAAFVQPRLKLVVAYSTVAQLGYLMVVFPLAGTLAWQGALYQLLSHALAKASMFLAATSVLQEEGDDRIDRLAGVDRRLPVTVFAFGLAGVSIMGLPPSGGFLAKWMLLEAAWEQDAWAWMVIIVLGSLLAAAYVFRVLGAAFRERQAPSVETATRPSLISLLALVLAVLSIVAGFASAPILALIETGSPMPAAGL